MPSECAVVAAVSGVSPGGSWCAAAMLGEKRCGARCRRYTAPAMRTSLAAFVVLAISCSQPPSPASPSSAARPGGGPAAADRGWIESSNQNAQLLLQVMAEFQPEAAARQGINGPDDRIADFGPGHLQRQREAIHK